MSPNSIYPNGMNPESSKTEQEDLQTGRVPLHIGEVASNLMAGMMLDRDEPNKEVVSLRGKVSTYGKMHADPTIGGALQGYENILSLVDWKVTVTNRETAGIKESEYDTKKAQEARDFVASNFADMTGTSIGDVVASALSMLAYGHQVLVPHFKVRSGYQNNINLSSKNNDGKIGWKNFKSIHSDSIERWLAPDGGGYSDLTGVRQLKVRGGYVDIPRNRMLLFRTTSKGDNIEGESILYSAVSTWKRLNKVLDVEEVSLSRNLEGIPHLRLPAAMLAKTATEEEKATLNLFLRMTKSVKFNNQTAIVTPSDLFEGTQERIIDLELLTAGPNVRVDQCRAVATACEQLMAESIMANFLKLGGGGGSYAMASSLQDMFVLAMKKYLNNISSVINEEAIPTLLRVNGMDTKYSPTLEHTGLDTDSIGVFVDALMKSIAAGAVVPTKGIQKSVLEKLKLPTAEADAEWDKIEELRQNLIDTKESEAGQAGIPDVTGKDVEDNSSLDELEAAGVELSPEKVSKSKDENIFESNGKFYKIEDTTVTELK